MIVFISKSLIEEYFRYFNAVVNSKLLSLQPMTVQIPDRKQLKEVFDQFDEAK